MNRNHLWRLLLILTLLFWSFQQVFFPDFRWIPLKGRNLIQEFADRGVKHDETFNKITARALELQKARPDQPFENLSEAVGTNDITRYFPFFEPQTETQPTTYILNRLQREAAARIKLGIDLAGGTSFLVKLGVGTNAPAQGGTNQVSAASDNKAAISQAIEVLRKRVDKFGVAEPLIQPQGGDRILIQLPGLSHSQMEDARRAIQKIAFLEFRLVHPESDALVKEGRVPPGYVVMTSVKTAPTGEKIMTKYLVKRTAELTGGIERAGVMRNTMGQAEIGFTLDAPSTKIFAKVTHDHVGQQLAIILDGELQSAPSIRSEIPNGSGQIEGGAEGFSDQEAFALANILENPLKTPLSIESSYEVQPTLGQDSIASGIRASLYGVIAVVAFMLLYYLFSGLVANAALMLNIVILLGVMCSIGTTLTLPGIAGIVLTIGMAVDANVLIYERIREELAAGKSMRGALIAGYDKAFGTIFDSNLTTLISSVILIFMGTGSVKGFGITLTIGVTVSMFTALVATRLIFDFLVVRGWLTSLRMLQFPFLHGTKFDFMRWAVPAFVASWLLILIGNGYGIIFRGHEVMGVEFAGGESITMSFDQQHKVDVGDLRRKATEASGGDVIVSYQHEVGTGKDSLRITTRISKDAGKQGNIADKTILTLQQAFPESKFDVIGRYTVGATVGAEITEAAILASLLAMFGILIYVAFRYEFSFAVGAVVAIIHDIFMTLGCYFLAGRELNATTVAAVLTIIGFSINDTIVIFDRIREDLRLGVRGTFREVMNQALNQTLSRTIITSGTVFLATLSLYIFGGGAINDFAFTFLVGVITGTYSSIYIASALVLWWHKGQRPKLGNTQMTAEVAAAEQRA